MKNFKIKYVCLLLIITLVINYCLFAFLYPFNNIVLYIICFNIINLLIIGMSSYKIADQHLKIKELEQKSLNKL